VPPLFPSLDIAQDINNKPEIVPASDQYNNPFNGGEGAVAATVR